MTITTQTRSIILQFGSLWHAVLFSFATMAESVYAHMTTERSAAGTPFYPDSDDQEAVSYEAPDEWTQAGGKRIEAGNILRHAQAVAGSDWSVVTLALSDNHAERWVATQSPAIRIAARIDAPVVYVRAVCRRWGEKQFNKRHAGAVSREYRIAYTSTVAGLIKLSGKSENTERQRRSEIYSILNAGFNTAKKKMDSA